jgi:hypothetical protein
VSSAWNLSPSANRAGSPTKSSLPMNLLASVTMSLATRMGPGVSHKHGTTRVDVVTAP